jgi:hypothetical protein
MYEEFSVARYCRQGHWVTATGRCVDGVCRELDLSEEQAKVAEKAERDS